MVATLLNYTKAEPNYGSADSGQREENNATKSHLDTSMGCEVTAMDSEVWTHVESDFRKALVALCMCSLSNALVIVNVFPYSGYMALVLLPQLKTLEAAASYAGLLAAAFMAGRFSTAYLWGAIADRYGRRMVLQCSMIGSILGSLLFGLSPSYRWALVGRLVLGMVNAVTSTSKTVASELGQGDIDRERQAMGLVVGMRSWGFLLGPAIGGILAEPIQQYPASSFVQSMPGFLRKILDKYPFLLPNLTVAIFCFMGFVLTTIWIPETLAKSEKQTDAKSDLPSSRPLIGSSSIQESTIETPYSIWQSSAGTRHCILFYCLVSFDVTMLDEAFPLFAMSTVGGLGLDEASIGTILSIAGLLFALLQYFIFCKVSQRYGTLGTVSIGSALGLIPLVFIPVPLTFCRPQALDTRDMEPCSWGLVFAFLSLLLGATKIMVCACFASLAIVTNQTVRASQRAQLNALLLMGGSLTKLVAPAFAGLLVSVSFSTTSSILPFLIPPPLLRLGPEWGSLVIFGIAGGLLGVATTVYAVQLPRLVSGSNQTH